MGKKRSWRSTAWSGAVVRPCRCCSDICRSEETRPGHQARRLMRAIVRKEPAAPIAISCRPKKLLRSPSIKKAELREFRSGGCGGVGWGGGGGGGGGRRPGGGRAPLETVRLAGERIGLSDRESKTLLKSQRGGLPRLLGSTRVNHQHLLLCGGTLFLEVGSLSFLSRR